MGVCLDTSAYVRFREGEPSAVEAVVAARDLAVPVIVLGELRTGFRHGTQAATNERRLREFLADPVVRVLDVDEDAADRYADHMPDLRRRGRPLPTNDVWIGALALREGLSILTADRHFEELRPAKVCLLPTAG